jgi:hypothetical protein
MINMRRKRQGIFLGLLFLILLLSFSCKKKEVKVTELTVSSLQVVFEPEGHLGRRGCDYF